MRGVERFWALFCPEALGIGSSVALKERLTKFRAFDVPDLDQR